MQKVTRTIYLFHILNIVLLFLLNNIYDWQGSFNLIALPMYIIPNVIGLILNIGVCSLIQKNKVKEKSISYIFPLIFFLINEISYFLYEKKMVFFGMFQTLTTSTNIIQIDNYYYLFISVSALLSSLIVFYKSMLNSKKI